MPRYPRISDTPDKFDSTENKLCRNCDKPIAEGRRHYCSSECMSKFILTAPDFRKLFVI
ncbi:MAG: hypothetical protein V1859_10815 [archaeon]